MNKLIMLPFAAAAVFVGGMLSSSASAETAPTVTVIPSTEIPITASDNSIKHDSGKHMGHQKKAKAKVKAKKHHAKAKAHRAKMKARAEDAAGDE